MVKLFLTPSGVTISEPVLPFLKQADELWWEIAKGLTIVGWLLFMIFQLAIGDLVWLLRVQVERLILVGRSHCHKMETEHLWLI